MGRVRTRPSLFLDYERESPLCAKLYVTRLGGDGHVVVTCWRAGISTTSSPNREIAYLHSSGRTRTARLHVYISTEIPSCAGEDPATLVRDILPFQLRLVK